MNDKIQVHSRIMNSTNLETQKVLMLVYAFPPRGAVGGSIRLIKFLKYMHEFKFKFKPVIITPTEEKVFLNDPHSSESLLTEIPPNFIDVIKTNSFQPLHPNPERLAAEALGSASSDVEKVVKRNVIKEFVKKVYSFVEKNILIPDYVVLWLPFMIIKAKREIKNNNIKIIYATAPPFSVLIGAAILKKITKTKLILDIKDDWIHQNKFKSKNLIIRKLELSLEKFCVKTADKVILVTESSLNDFDQRYTNSISKFELIPNGCDLSEYRKYWDIKFERNEKFTIIHAGVINSARDPENLLLALKQLKESNQISKNNFQFIFIGPLPQSVSNSIEKHNINDIVKNIGYMSNISREYIIKLMSADLLVAINYPIKTLIPAKLYDYWASKSPIVLLDEPNTMATKFVNQNNLGKCNSLKDIGGMKKLILEYFHNWSQNIPINKLDISKLEMFDRKFLTQKLIELFNQLDH